MHLYMKSLKLAKKLFTLNDMAKTLKQTNLLHEFESEFISQTNDTVHR